MKKNYESVYRMKLTGYQVITAIVILNERRLALKSQGCTLGNSEEYVGVFNLLAVFLICFPPDTTEYLKSSHLYTAISRSMKVAFFVAKLRLPRAIRAWHTRLRLSRHTSQKSLSVALLQPANFSIV